MNAKDFPPAGGTRPRVLLLRSFCRPTFCATLARALRRHSGIEFAQYPRFPSDQNWRLKKLYRADEAWDDLHVNVIESAAEFRRKLFGRAFDLILLADDEAHLFRLHGQPFAGLRSAADAWSRAVHLSPRMAREYYRYEHAMPVSLAELRRYAPVAAIENRDAACLSPRNRMIFEESTVFFKRELPYDRFFMYYPDRPAPWAEWRKKLLPQFNKVHGIPLGIEDDKYADLKARRRTKQDIDVFLSGVVTNTQRKTAETLLKAWDGKKRWNLVIGDSWPFEEYCDLVSRSKITISIAGSRWECFRHYEAVALGSVPLMNRPTVDAVWWHGLPDALFFENSFENYEQRIENLLKDDELRRIALARVEERIEAHMLHSRMIDYIVRTALEAPGPEGGESL